MPAWNVDTLTYGDDPAGVLRSGLFANVRFDSTRWQPGDADPPSPASSHWSVFSEQYVAGEHHTLKPMGVWQYAIQYEFALATGDWTDWGGTPTSGTPQHAQGDGVDPNSYLPGRAAILAHWDATTTDPGMWLIADAARKAKNVVVQVNFNVPWYLSSSSDPNRDAFVPDESDPNFTGHAMRPQRNYNRFPIQPGEVAQAELETLLEAFVHRVCAAPGAGGWAGKKRLYEIGNEDQLYWRGSPAEYLERYRVTARAIAAAEASFNWAGEDPGEFRIGGSAPAQWAHELYQDGVGFTGVSVLGALINGGGVGGESGFANDPTVPFDFVSWHIVHEPAFLHPFTNVGDDGSGWAGEAMTQVRAAITATGADPNAFDYLLTEWINDGTQGTEPELAYSLEVRAAIALGGFTGAVHTAAEDWGNRPLADNGGEGIYHKAVLGENDPMPKPHMALHESVDQLGRMADIQVEFVEGSGAAALHGRTGTAHMVIASDRNGAPWSVDLDSPAGSTITVTNVRRFDGLDPYPGNVDANPTPATSVSIPAASGEVLAIEYTVEPVAGYWTFDGTQRQALVASTLPGAITNQSAITLLAIVRLPSGQTGGVLAAGPSGDRSRFQVLGPRNDFALEVDRIRGAQDDGQGATGLVQSITAGSTTAGTWHAIAATFSAAEVRAYLDGTLEAASAGDGFAPIEQLAVGAFGDDPAAWASQFLTGDVAAMTWVAGALSEAELDEFHTGGTGGIFLEPTACSWAGSILAYLPSTSDSLGSLVNGLSVVFANSNGAVYVPTGGPTIDPNPAAPEVPGQVTGVAGVPASEAATITWSAPYAGSASITSYRVDIRPAGGGASVAGYPLDTGSSSTTHIATLTGQNGNDLEALVEAQNSVGYGEQSLPSAAFTPQTILVPVAPVLAADANDYRSVTFTLDDPVADATGQRPITDTRLERRQGADPWATVTGGAWDPASTQPTGAGAFTDDQGLDAGGTYEYRHVYRNAVGETASNVVSVTLDAAPSAPVLVPGTGWLGPTTEPGPIGNTSDPFYTAQVIGHWNEVPHRDVPNGTFTVGAVVFHGAGIDRVEASVDDGPWLAVSSMTLNARSDCWEYVFAIDTSTLADGAHELRAIAYPNFGEPFLLDYDISFASGIANDTSVGWPFYTNHGGGLDATSTTVYADSVSGSPSNGGTSPGDAVDTIATALSLVKIAQTNPGGATILLAEGSYAMPTDAVAGGERWLTIRGAPGTDPDLVNLTGPDFVLANTRLHLAHLTNRDVGYASGGRCAWIGNDFRAEGGTQSYVMSVPLSNKPNLAKGLNTTAQAGTFREGTYQVAEAGAEIQYRFTQEPSAGDILVRNAYFHRLWRDVNRNTRHMINVRADWQGGYTLGVDGAHADLIQLWNGSGEGAVSEWSQDPPSTEPASNFTMVNVRTATHPDNESSPEDNSSVQWCQRSGTMTAGLHRVAFVNCELRRTPLPSTKGDGSWFNTTNHFLLWHCSFEAPFELAVISDTFSVRNNYFRKCQAATAGGGVIGGATWDANHYRDNPGTAYGTNATIGDAALTDRLDITNVDALLPLASSVLVTTYAPTRLVPFDARNNARSLNTARGAHVGPDEADPPPVAVLAVEVDRGQGYVGGASGGSINLGEFTTSGTPAPVTVRLTASGATVTMGNPCTASGQVDAGTTTIGTINDADVEFLAPLTFNVGLDVDTAGVWSAFLNLPNTTGTNPYTLTLDFTVADQSAPHMSIEAGPIGGPYTPWDPAGGPITFGAQTPDGAWRELYEVRQVNDELPGGPSATISAPQITGAFRAGSGSDPPGTLAPGAVHTTVLEVLADDPPEVTGTLTIVNDGVYPGADFTPDDPVYTLTVPVDYSPLPILPRWRSNLALIGADLITVPRDLVRGTLDGDLGGLAAQIVGARRRSGDIDGDLGGLGAALVGSTGIRGPLEADLPGLGADLEASRLSVGPLEADLPGVGGDLTGARVSVGDLAADLPGLGMVAVGSGVEVGSLLATLPGLGGDLDAVRQSVGTLITTLPGFGAAVAGDTGEVGLVLATLPGLGAMLDGTRITAGSLAADLPGLEAMLRQPITAGSLCLRFEFLSPVDVAVELVSCSCVNDD